MKEIIIHRLGWLVIQEKSKKIKNDTTIDVDREVLLTGVGTFIFNEKKNKINLLMIMLVSRRSTFNENFTK